MTKHLFATVALALITAQPAFAADYQLTVQGNVNSNSTTLYGSTGTVLPLMFSFIVDSTLATKINAGTPFSGSNSFSQDAYLIPRAATSSIPVTIGANGAWSKTDLLLTPLGSAGSFDILITGSFVAPTGILMVFNNGTSGYLEIGDLFCSPACVILNTGDTVAVDSASGTLSDITVSSNLVNTSIETKITSLVELLDAMSTDFSGVKRSLSAKLQAALRVLKNNDRAAAKNILGAFKNEALAQRNVGLSSTQADSLISSANNIIASL